jgi:recombination protein RecA
MTDEKKEKLELAISAIQKRWGNRIIGRSTQHRPSAFPTISTSFPQLDEALGIGGIPRGRISELVGIPTSGMATLAMKIITQVQEQGGTTVYLDLTRTFDPAYAWRCGVQLSHLTLVHPYTVQQSLSILSDFIINGGIDLLIFDMPLSLQIESRNALKLNATLGRLLAPLSKNDCALLFLTSMPPKNDFTYPDHATLPYYATLRLLLNKERWLYKQRDVRGYEAQVHIAKNKLHTPGQNVRIGITFNGTVEGDSL